jgi:regulator of sigma E protease
MSVIIFLVVLGILIVVHEWGHYIAARKQGIGVEQFSVGFGPKLFSWKADGTEFMVCAIPLGGFVKLAGDDRTKLTGRPEEFFSHPVGHRAIVILMGPLVNIVFAYFCFWIVFMGGFPVISPRVGAVMPNYPAQAAGIAVGDLVVQINEKKIASWDDLQEYVSASKGTPLTFKLIRDGQAIEKVILPKLSENKNLFGQTVKVNLVGVQPGDDPKEAIILLRYGPLESLSKAAIQMYKLTVLTFKGLYHVIIGTLPAQDAFAGPIRIFDIIALSAERGFTHLLFIMGIISANLAIFNLFPVPVLDGGHLLFLAIEKIRGKALSLKFEENLTKIGFGLLMALMVFVVYNDMSSMGWFTKLQKLFNH